MPAGKYQLEIGIVSSVHYLFQCIEEFNNYLVL